jgi:hypothetical protein
MVMTIAHCLSLALFSAPKAVPAPANARGIVKHAPQKFSFMSDCFTIIEGLFNDRREFERSSSSSFKDAFLLTIYLLLYTTTSSRAPIGILYLRCGADWYLSTL